MPKNAEAKALREKLDLGDKYLNELSYEQAIASYFAVIEIDPKNEDALLGLADAYIAMGEYDKAEEVLENALENLDGDVAEIIKEKLDEVREKKNVVEETPEPTNTPGVTEKPEPMLTNTPVPTLPVTVSIRDFTWTENSEGTLTIESYRNTKATNVLVPNEIDGKIVTVLGGSAFSDCENMVSVILPETIIKINRYAFDNCKSLKEIVVEEKNKYFTSIEGSLYSKDMTVLLKVPDAFQGRFVIPATVTDVEGAFRDCAYISEIVITNAMTIGFEVGMTGCNSLERFVLEVPHSIYSVLNGALFSNHETCLLCVPAKSQGTAYEIPELVFSMFENAFSDCVELEKVHIPAGLADYSAIQHVNGYTYDNLKWNYFYGCESLKEISVAADCENYKSIDGVLFTKDGTTLISMPCNYSKEDYVIPECVTSISYLAFYNCKNLKSVTIPDSVVTIGPNAFKNCRNLDSVIMGESVKTIGVSAFRGCDALDNFILPEGVISLHDMALLGCFNLKTIAIPASVCELGEHVFSKQTTSLIVLTGSYAEQWALDNGYNVEYIP